MFFSLISQIVEEARAYHMIVEGQPFQYNPKPKILGVALDEKLKFDVHTEQLERKALRSLDLLRRVKETETISTNVCSSCIRLSLHHSCKRVAILVIVVS